MNFLKKIKLLLSKDTKEIEELEKEMPELTGHECWWCENDITVEHKKKSFNKKKFHIQCYRDMIKEVKKDMGAR